MAKVGTPFSGKSLGTVLLLVSLMGGCSRGGPPPNAGGPPGIPVKLQTVASGTVEESSEFVGSLEADQAVVLRPVTDGRVVQIFVGSGSRVAAGTPILQLKPEKGQAELGGAIANINARRAALSNARAQLKAAEAERVSAAADVELRNQEYQRFSQLVAQGAFAQQRLDEVRRNRDVAAASLAAVDERVRAARATLDQENSALQQAQANAALSSENLQETRVVAPIAGVVGDLTVKLGDYISPNTTLTKIVQNQTLSVRLSIPDNQAAKLRIGIPVQLYEFTGNEIIGTGRISFVSPQVNAESQSILAKASFANPEGTLRDGQQVRSRVIWERKPGVSIPTTAISRVAGQNFVYVAETKDAKLIARQKPVKLGNIQGNNYQITEGLKQGERVIVSGVLNLTDGAPIAPES